MGGTPLLLIGILYFIVRIAGKYLGAFLGCKAVGCSKNITRYLGLALIPQAGVAIGLAALGARTLGANGGRIRRPKTRRPSTALQRTITRALRGKERAGAPGGST